MKEIQFSYHRFSLTNLRVIPLGGVFALIDLLEGLTRDRWWEVAAQLILLLSRLLLHLSSRQDQGETQEMEARLLGILLRVFVPNNSKNVLQVGLSELAPVLGPYSGALLPNYVAVLLAHPHPLRRRLLGFDDQNRMGQPGQSRRLAYVMGTSL